MFLGLAARLPLAAAGLALALAGSYGFVAASNGGEIESLSAHVKAGDRFGFNVLEGFEPSLSQAVSLPVPNPLLLREIAVIRLRQADVRIAASPVPTDAPEVLRAEQAARAALRITPTDGFLWFALAWLAKTRGGFDDAVMSELEMSYAMAPHEGWIAVHRNAFAVPLLSSLPPGLRDAVIREFGNLVVSGYIPNAAEILTGPGWGERDALLKSLDGLPLYDRTQFARELQARGENLFVPGVDVKTPPWRR